MGRLLDEILDFGMDNTSIAHHLDSFTIFELVVFSLVGLNNGVCLRNRDNISQPARYNNTSPVHIRMERQPKPSVTLVRLYFVESDAIDTFIGGDCISGRNKFACAASVSLGFSSYGIKHHVTKDNHSLEGCIYIRNPSSTGQ